MGRIVTSISQSSRLTQKDFSEARPAATLGPDVSAANVNGEAIQAPANQVATVNQWVAMTQGEQGLLDAIYNFINTTKDGISVTPNNIFGRTKKLTFNFYGTMGKSIMPGEIGQFEVNFSYPPVSVKVPANNTAQA